MCRFQIQLVRETSETKAIFSWTRYEEQELPTPFFFLATLVVHKKFAQGSEFRDPLCRPFNTIS